MNNPSGQPAQPFAGAVPANTVLDNRYRLDGRIATGGMGEVWRGVDQTLGRPVAVKLLRPEYASDESFLVRFRGEARHAARLSHPGVASVYDYGEVATVDDHPTAYLVMELVEGEPLSALLHREKRLSPERMLDILGQAADALQAAHALGVVHRDVKPGNLLLRPDGAVKVTDFGIARAVDAAPLTATGIMMGTAYYVSPEQASGRPVTPASDVYSLGVVAYECLAGRRPFDDRNPIVVVMAHQQDTPPPLPSDVPYQVRALVESAMAKNAARRPASAGAFARTAAGIRRDLWNPDPRWTGSGGASPDMTARHPGPSGPPPPRARTRTPSWMTDGPSGATPPGGRPGAKAGPYGGPSSPGSGAPNSPAGSTAHHAAQTSYQPAPGSYQPAPTAYQQVPGGYQPASPAQATRASANDGYQGAPVGRAGRRRAAAPTGRRRRLSLPVLLVLLALTVAVTALVTRSLAGSGNSAGSHQGASSVTRAVTTSTAGDGIVRRTVDVGAAERQSVGGGGPGPSAPAEAVLAVLALPALGGSAVGAVGDLRGDGG
jgi:serine/threonine-protein kinase